MRLAVLILACYAPRGLAILEAYFRACDADLLVHVDAKMPIEPFRAHADPAGRLRFVEPRESVFWGGFNMVRAVVHLLQAAERNGGYDRYLLISDDSLPLLSPGALCARLAEDVEFMEMYRIEPGDRMHRYEGFFMLDSGATSARGAPVNDREITAECLAAMARLTALRQQGKKPFSSIHGGSQWWAVRRPLVETILDSYDNDDWMRESFEFSAIPDEAYFHTIIADRCPPARFTHFMYTDFSRDPRPYVFRDADELRALNPHGRLFVRKVDMAAPWLPDLLHTF